VIQESLADFRIVYVPDEGFSSETEALLRRNMMDRLGKVNIQFEQVGDIPVSANGKFHSVISKLPKTISR
jgi:hypothetical protein